jgi:hypothetical protein
LKRYLVKLLNRLLKNHEKAGTGSLKRLLNRLLNRFRNRLFKRLMKRRVMTHDQAPE